MQPLSPISDKDHILVKTEAHKECGKVVKPAGTPRSYIVETNSGLLRCNHQYLTVFPEGEINIKPEQESVLVGPRTTHQLVPVVRLTKCHV